MIIKFTINDSILQHYTMEELVTSSYYKQLTISFCMPSGWHSFLIRHVEYIRGIIHITINHKTVHDIKIPIMLYDSLNHISSELLFSRMSIPNDGYSSNSDIKIFVDCNIMDVMK